MGHNNSVKKGVWNLELLRTSCLLFFEASLGKACYSPPPILSPEKNRNVRLVPKLAGVLANDKGSNGLDLAEGVVDEISAIFEA
jgi:hypothetical protein